MSSICVYHKTFDLRSFSRKECAVDGEYFEEDMAKIERSDRRPNHNTRKRMKEDAEEGILHPESILKGLKTHECSLRELRTNLFNNLLQLQVMLNVFLRLSSHFTCCH